LADERAKIFVVDDHAGMASALARFIAAEFEVIGTAANAEQALADQRLEEAAVAIVDVSLPGMNGIDLVDCLRKRWPHLRCLMLSGHDSISYVRRALAAGASGYLRKDDPDEILPAIRQVHAGGRYIGRQFRDAIGAGA